ncbi:MAG: hypothetical protein AAGA99_01075 [Actinomycetota bacterium]
MDDPVREQRARIDRWASLGRRVGLLLYAVATVIVLVGVLTSFGSALATIVTALLIIGSVVLAPSILLGYAVRAAERDDREHGR